MFTVLETFNAVWLPVLIGTTNIFVGIRELLDELVRHSFNGSNSWLGLQW